MEEQGVVNSTENQSTADLGYGIYGMGYVKPIEEIKFTGFEKAMSFIALGLSFMFVHFVLKIVQGYFTTVFYILMITAALIFMHKTGIELGKNHKAWAVIMYLFAAVFSITANSFVKFLDTVFMTAGIAYLLYAGSLGSKMFGRFAPFEILKSLFANPFSQYSKEYKAMAQVSKSTSVGKHIKGVFGGALLAVPLTVIVANLLMAADDGMQRMLGAAFDFFTNISAVWRLVWELILAIPVSGYLFGLLYSHAHKSDRTALDEAGCEELGRSVRKISLTALYTSVTPICVLYVMFFISQANYFLSAFGGRLPDGYSFAEYARRGFFELFAIELINAGVIFFINIFSKTEGDKKPLALKIYTVIISVFTLLITATAISKMVLYISSYGLTQLRVYTTWFMVLTAIMFIFVIILQFKQGFKFMKAAAVCFTLMFGLLCFSRPDALIAKYDLEYCANTISAKDIMDLASLSSDSAAVVADPKYKALIESKLNENSDYTPYMLYRRIERQLEGSEYAKFNLSAALIDERLKHR